MISQTELEKYLWNSAEYLRTHIDAGAYKQYIFPLLFLKRICDVYDEEKQHSIEKYGSDFPENHRFNVPEGYHWNDIRKVASDVGAAIKKAFTEIENANPEFLAGIFGDGTWTNKRRLTDELLKNLIEHFSSKTLSIENCPEDELGQGYEYLIKQFADDSGHTAQEFYTNRTVVHLMTQILKPQSGESIYDPTCGTGGMLISAIAHLKNQNKEWRNVKLYGQEINALSSAIARMNLFLHGIEDFYVENGDTLQNPKYVKNNKLMKFNVVFANPPYSIKQWDRIAFSKDKYGRNFLGTPPQGRADYAFFQHILKSLDDNSGRCAILFPHGVLFRNEEYEMRKKLIESDMIECVIGLAKNLFYNSPMEACIVVCRTQKPENRKGKILIINAKDYVSRIKNQSFLEENHIQNITETYEDFAEYQSISKVITTQEAIKNEYSLSIPLYVSNIPSVTETHTRRGGACHRPETQTETHTCRGGACHRPKTETETEFSFIFGQRQALPLQEWIQCSDKMWSEYEKIKELIDES